MIQNLTKIAVQIITVTASSMIQQAQAIFFQCIDNCNSHQNAHEAAKLVIGLKFPIFYNV